jgi:hypothetical protein
MLRLAVKFAEDVTLLTLKRVFCSIAPTPSIARRFFDNRFTPRIESSHRHRPAVSARGCFLKPVIRWFAKLLV